MSRGSPKAGTYMEAKPQLGTPQSSPSGCAPPRQPRGCWDFPVAAEGPLSLVLTLAHLDLGPRTWKNIIALKQLGERSHLFPPPGFHFSLLFPASRGLPSTSSLVKQWFSNRAVSPPDPKGYVAISGNIFDSL